jgi:chromosome segregation ATPase
LETQKKVLTESIAKYNESTARNNKSLRNEVEDLEKRVRELSYEKGSLEALLLTLTEKKVESEARFEQLQTSINDPNLTKSNLEGEIKLLRKTANDLSCDVIREKEALQLSQTNKTRLENSKGRSLSRHNLTLKLAGCTRTKMVSPWRLPIY